MIGMTKCIYGDITITSINKNDLIKVENYNYLNNNHQNNYYLNYYY